MMGANELKMDFMSKRSQMKGVIKTDSYKSRWFKLTPTTLFYCDGKIDTGIGKIKGHIELKTIKVIENVDGEGLGNKSNVFQIVYTDKSKLDTNYTLYIVAAHSQQREDWLTALRDAAKKEGATFYSTYHLGVWLYKLGKWSCCDNFNAKGKGCQPTFCSTSEDLSVETNKSKRESRITFATKLLALYEYVAKDKEEISMKKGEELELLSPTLNDNWVKVKNDNGKIGLVPSEYLQKVNANNLESFEWYFKDLSRAQAESILEANGQEGCFIIRDSSKNAAFTVSLFYKSDKKSEGEVKHYHIKKSGNEYYLTEKHKFSTLPQLIYYHKHNCAGLITRLKFPPSNQVKPAVLLSNTVHINPTELLIKEKLGAGQFGTVHKAIYKGSIEVAVKTMKEGSMSESQFLEEAEIMAKLHHPNLVRLYGVSTTKKPIMILTEYMKHGSLYAYLRRSKHHLIKKQDKLIDICLQVCKAMDYLEKNMIIHRDLAARNCLVGDNFVVKVCDFGLARFVLDDEYTSSEGAKFPVRWASVEVLEHQLFSSKSDVWAFGILMWEVFTCCDLPYEHVENKDVYDYVAIDGNRLEKPEKCSEEIFKLMAKMWLEEPNERPNFENILEELTKIND